MTGEDQYHYQFTLLQGQLNKLSRDLKKLQDSRVIRVYNVSKDDWTPPVEPVHTCGANCEPATDDKVGLCEVTELELQKAHRKAVQQLDWLNRFYPIQEED